MGRQYRRVSSQMTEIDLSVVIPTYRGRDSIEELIERLVSVLRLRNQPFEIVVVNDSSPDDTWDILRRAADRYREVVAIDLLHNHGQARATICGLAHTRGRLVATMDDDLQQPPEELPKLIEAIEEHQDWDAVVGSWPRDSTILRNLGSIIHAVMDRMAHGTRPGFRHTTFRVMRRPVVDALVAHRTRTPVMSPLVSQVVDRLHNVEVEHRPRPYGRSTITIRESVSRVLTNFLQGSTLPLQWLSRFGLVAAFGSLLMATFFLVRWAIGVQTPPGWASTFLTTAFFGGAILFGIGLLGEYMKIIMEEVRRAPRWSIRQVAGTRHGDDSIRPEPTRERFTSVDV